MGGEELESDFDKAFDDGEDMTPYVDWSRARQPGKESRRVNVDFPASMVESLDREAARIGVTRQSLIKMWLADRLDRNWRDRHPGANRLLTQKRAESGWLVGED